MAEEKEQEEALEISGFVIKPDAEEVNKDEEVMPSNLMDKDTRFDRSVLGLQEPKVLQPTYDPLILKRLVQRNNALFQAIDAYKVNIDGSGHGFRRADGEALEDADFNDEEYKVAESFFKEPFFRWSMIDLREMVREDLETTGNAYLEVLRNSDAEFSMLKHAPTENMRVLALDNEPQTVETEIERAGKKETVIFQYRFRRFVQLIGNKAVYFKEIGAPLELNKRTGEWGETVPDEEKATEIIWLKEGKDPDSPYGVPRWINQMPSVLGSRKAEESNLEFFNRGGIPPIAIFVGGGKVGEENEKNIRALMSGKSVDKQAAAVISVQSTSGSIEKQAAPQIRVERFGSEQQKDSLYENYDMKSEQRVRSSFRLPPLFVGRTESMNFATAFASYVVAENQVFRPIREKFDHMINRVVMPLLGVTKYEFFSKPTSITSAEVKLKAAALLRDKTDTESFVEQINDCVGTDFIAREESEFEDDDENSENEGGGEGVKPRSSETPGDQEESARPQVSKSQRRRVRKADPNYIKGLVNEWCIANGYEDGEEFDPSINEIVDKLDEESAELFNTILAKKLVNPIHDEEGCGDLIKAAVGFSD